MKHIKLTENDFEEQRRETGCSLNILSTEHRTSEQSGSEISDSFHGKISLNVLVYMQEKIKSLHLCDYSLSQSLRLILYIKPEKIRKNTTRGATFIRLQFSDSIQTPELGSRAATTLSQR